MRRKRVIDYNQYKMSTKEILMMTLEIVLADGLVSYLFYRSVFAMILGIPIGYFWYRRKKKFLIGQRKKRLRTQFKDAILAISTALNAGYSVEHAFIESIQDLKMIYPSESEIVREFIYIKGQLQNNIVLEKLLMDFGKRSHVEEIMDFVQIFNIAKRKGGDFARIIQNTANVINEKIEVHREIETILTSKQFEQRIMSMVPLLIILYIGTTSPHFFDVLYHNLFGICIMSGCLVLYGFSLFLAEKIIEIHI